MRVLTFITVSDKHTQTQGYTVCRVQALGTHRPKPMQRFTLISSKAISTSFFNQDFSTTWLLFLVSTYDC